MLCMRKVISKHNAEQIRAKYYSTDGENYEEIPKAINVLGSRYALAIKNLKLKELDLLLAKTIVSVGACKGRAGNEYIKGRVDKACLTFTNDLDSLPVRDKKTLKSAL